MTKAELIKALENYDDNTPIILWAWTKKGSKFEYLNQICSNNRTDDNGNLAHPDFFGLSNSGCNYIPEGCK